MLSPAVRAVPDQGAQTGLATTPHQETWLRTQAGPHHLVLLAAPVTCCQQGLCAHGAFAPTGTCLRVPGPALRVEASLIWNPAMSCESQAASRGELAWRT
jgi:hypothetical protein